MARIASPDSRTVVVTIRLAAATVHGLDAARGSTSRARWIADTITDYLLDPVAPVTPGRPRLDGDGLCTHPKTMLRVFSWGTMCGCGARVR